MADKDEPESTESTPSDDAAGTPEPTDPTVSPASPSSEGEEPGDERVPEPVGAGASTKRAGASSSGGVAGAAKPQKKDRPTAKRDSAAAEPHRTGPVTFVKESVAELRKVVYPTGPQLVNYFIVVLIFVLFIIAYVSLLDLGLGAAMFRIFA